MLYSSTKSKHRNEGYVEEKEKERSGDEEERERKKVYMRGRRRE